MRHTAWACLAAAGLLLATAAPVEAQAQTRPPPEQHFQLWPLVTVTGHGAERWRYYAELQPRFDVGGRYLDRLLLRGAGGFDLTSAVSVWLGYAWTPLFAGGALQSEHRTFEQLLIDVTVGTVRWVNRTRFEQRFLAGASGVSLRARHMVRAVVPLGGGWAIPLYDELFVHLNSVTGGPTAGLDQNRLFLGISKALGPAWTVEAGYMSNFVWRLAAPTNRLNHNAVLWLAWNTDGAVQAER